MIIIANEKTARNLFVTYSDIVALTWDKKMGRPSKELIDQGAKLSYTEAGFLPDRDVINSIINGETSIKKVVRDIKKSLFNYKSMSDEGIATAIHFGIILRMYESIKRPVIVFVEPIADDDIDQKVNKIMARIICEIFAELDMVVIGGSYSDKTGKKLCKKYTKIFNKIMKMQIKVKDVIDDDTGKVLYRKPTKNSVKKITKKIRELADSSKCLGISKKGMALSRRLDTIFAIENRNAGIAQFNIKKLRGKKRVGLAKTLMVTLSGDNLDSIPKLNPLNKKDEKMLGKSIARVDKNHMKNYKKLREIIDDVNDALPEYKLKSLPALKYCYNQNKKKEVKKAEKFVEFFTKPKNTYLLCLTYAHLAALNLGVAPGKSEYKRAITNAVKGLCPEEFVDAFLASAKDEYKDTSKI